MVPSTRLPTHRAIQTLPNRVSDDPEIPTRLVAISFLENGPPTCAAMGRAIDAGSLTGAGSRQWSGLFLTVVGQPCEQNTLPYCCARNVGKQRLKVETFGLVNSGCRRKAGMPSRSRTALHSGGVAGPLNSPRTAPDLVNSLAGRTSSSEYRTAKEAEQK